MEVEALQAEVAALREALAAQTRRAEESERLFEALVEHSPDIIVRYDAEHRHLFANAATARLTGAPVEAWIGKTHQEMAYPPDVCEAIQAANRKLFESGEPQTVEVMAEHPTGATYFELRLSPELRDGQVVSAIVVSRDMTAQKEAQARAQKHERLLAAVFEHSQYFLGILEPDGTMVDASPSALAAAGAARADVVGRPLWASPWWDGLPELHDDLRAAVATVAGGGSFVRELPYLAAGGERRLTDFSLRPMADEAGRLVLLLAQGSDVTERRHTEAELRRQQELMAKIIDHAPIAISYLDQDLVYQWVNRSQAETYGIPVEQWLGRSVYDVLGPKTEAQIRPFWEQALGGTPFIRNGYPFEYTTLAGEQAWTFWDFSYHPVFGDAGAVEGILVHGQEVTARVEREQLKERLVAERIAHLEEANVQKQQFLSILSHELRTPINAIMGFASVLDEGVLGALTPPQHDAAGKILAGAERMLALINDLLDMSRLQAGKFVVVVEPAHVAAIVAEAVAALQPLAAQKGLALVDALPPGLPGLQADPQRVGQVLTNLLANAIKFTPPGGRIRVEARVEGDGLRIAVADSGIGVAEGHRERIFDAFTQVDMSNTRGVGGTGLGLSIAKALVEAHGGRIGVESEGAGRGATFWFTLPLAPGAPA